jgi:hypothetical protein
LSEKISGIKSPLMCQPLRPSASQNQNIRHGHEECSRKNSIWSPTSISGLTILSIYYWLLLAESHLTRRLFAGMPRKITALPWPAG